MLSYAMIISQAKRSEKLYWVGSRKALSPTISSTSILSLSAGRRRQPPQGRLEIKCSWNMMKEANLSAHSINGSPSSHFANYIQ